ncbi:hypothetical protein GCM10008959_15780 [Deinococcus seoulensis]|uniref:Uncharacterized protein n=1 Tax=Deinococcus seoulensis TaxID=1837379 RepID=A0ABQ2RQA7_9DEIO|nr:hypothetical protein GCM10008959_15780 [Deinococcus seoulensis]
MRRGRPRPILTTNAREIPAQCQRLLPLPLWGRGLGGGEARRKAQTSNRYNSQITPPAISPAPVPTSSAVSPSFSRPASTA